MIMSGGGGSTILKRNAFISHFLFFKEGEEAKRVEALEPTFNFLSFQCVCLLLLAAARCSLLKGNFVSGHRQRMGRERVLGKH